MQFIKVKQLINNPHASGPRFVTEEVFINPSLVALVEEADIDLGEEKIIARRVTFSGLRVSIIMEGTGEGWLWVDPKNFKSYGTETYRRG